MKIAPPNQSTGDFLRNMVDGASDRERLLQEFLDLCEADSDVKKVMIAESLSRSDLERFYERLVEAGLGQWVGGHYVALSTIAYYEPLLYVARSEKQGTPWEEVVFGLMHYWERSIPNGALLHEFGIHGPA